jgi:hypothetical protein
MSVKHRFLLVLLIIFLASCQSNPQVHANSELADPIFISETVEEIPPAAIITPIPTETPGAPLSSVQYTPQSNSIPDSNLIGLNGFPPNFNPLTGLPVSQPDLLNRRPLLVKVSNYPRYGRPHAGLSYADVVFEYYIGEQVNRFLALYYGQDCQKIGPVRSGRYVDYQLTRMYSGILAYGNADPKVEKVLVAELGERAIAFNDAPSRVMNGTETHSVAGVFANSIELSQFAEELGVENFRPNLQGTIFSTDIPQDSPEATFIGVEYSSINRGEWHYDESSGKYLRWIEDLNDDNEIIMIPLVDRLTNEQLAFSNVIIIFAPYTEFAPTVHDIGIWNNQEGRQAVIFRDGKLIDGFWRTVDHELPLQFYDTSGKPIPLKSGNSWIIIAGLNSIFVDTLPGHWEMLFDLP